MSSSSSLAYKILGIGVYVKGALVFAGRRRRKKGGFNGERGRIQPEVKSTKNLQGEKKLCGVVVKSQCKNT